MYVLYDSLQVLSSVIVGVSDGLEQLVVRYWIYTALWLDIELVVTAR